MALVYTPPGELDSVCPNFELPGTDGKNHGLKDLENAPAAIVMFICNHCPYVIAIEDRLVELGHEMKALGVPVLAISSNDAKNYPEDSFEKMKEKNYPFPYLIDEDQTVGKTFGAVCTPDFFVYDKNLHLAYRGRLDDSWKDSGQVTKRELKLAVDKVISGEDLAEQQYPSMGCSIKWKN